MSADKDSVPLNLSGQGVGSSYIETVQKRKQGYFKFKCIDLSVFRF